MNVLKIIRKISSLINCSLFYVFKMFPLHEFTIILESEGDLCDNAYALYEYMIENKYDNKYHILWLVDNKNKFKGYQYISKSTSHINIRLMYYLAVSKYYIYDHNNLLMYLNKRKKQNIIYLSHGFGFKKGTLKNKKKIKTDFDIMIATGDLPAKGNSEFWQSDINKVVKLGYSRLDYFFKDNSIIYDIVNKKFKIDKYKKIILWMPTFRQSVSKEISENYLNNETGLPLLTTKESIYTFNEYLHEENLLFILKLHHLQADLPIFKESYSNICILKVENLQDLNIQLYQFISLTDVLVTDYSSISVDYLLLNRPIIYTLDDYEDYNKSRGVYPENAIDYMPGYHVFNLQDMITAIDEISIGLDKYKQSRIDMLPVFFTYVDGNASKRILDYLEIKL